jgi:hypothetical protein
MNERSGAEDGRTMKTKTSLIERHAVLEEMLDEWSSALGPAGTAYRGHAYRVYNLARHLAGSNSRDAELAIASAYHDLGIWSDRTFDYLGPSIARADRYVSEHAPAVPLELVRQVIDNHHALRRIRVGLDPDLCEAFRRADLVDLTGGLYRAGLDRGFLRELVAVFPYAGFHGVLARVAWAWFLKHPLRPLPMLRLSGSAE